MTTYYDKFNIKLDNLNNKFRKLVKKCNHNIKNSFIRINNKRLFNVPVEDINSRIKTILKSANDNNTKKYTNPFSK